MNISFKLVADGKCEGVSADDMCLEVRVARSVFVEIDMGGGDYIMQLSPSQARRLATALSVIADDASGATG